MPYKTLKETIGQTYVLLPLVRMDEKTGYNAFYKVDDATFRFSAKEGAGKKFKLVSIDDNNGYFVDSIGIKYKAHLIDKMYFFSLAPTSDIEEARKLFLNKTLWLNNTEYLSGDPFSLPYEVNQYVKLTRFDPVTVINVTPGFFNDYPVIITFKTAKGETFFRVVSVSGTNSNLQPDFAFDKYFFTEDPKLKYHFTPKIWDYIKVSVPILGMNKDAVRLCEGIPKHVNTGGTVNNPTEQWVYGSGTAVRYFYFTNGILTNMDL